MVQDTLERTKKLVWPIIESYLKDPVYPTQFSIATKFKKEVDFYWKINKTYPERKGKYLRPTAVLLIAEAMGVKTEDAIKTAAAMQISEDWILISDDIEDNSSERRGAPTLHKTYGLELAMNASDTLETVMWKMVLDINSKEIADEFYKIVMRTALGQAVEQIWTNEKKTLSESEYYFVADSKSGYYSIAGPMRLGAVLGKANSKQLEKITEFGLHLGRCFQLIDDILDIDQDKKEGKSTLAISKGAEFTRKLAKTEKEKAKQIFENELEFLSNEPARTNLKDLMDFILERQY